MIGAPNSLNLNCKVRVMKEAPGPSVSEEIADIFTNYNIDDNDDNENNNDNSNNYDCHNHNNTRKKKLSVPLLFAVFVRFVLWLSKSVFTGYRYSSS